MSGANMRPTLEGPGPPSPHCSPPARAGFQYRAAGRSSSWGRSMSTDGPIDHPVTAAIEAAEEICDQGEDWIDEKPRLLIDVVNPDLTVAALRDVLANSSVLYERGVPVRLAFDQRRRC